MPIFESVLAKNGQVTVKKKIRDELDIEPGDIIFLDITKVISPKGIVKYGGTDNGGE